MRAQTECPQCHAPIQNDAPDGFCPACVFEAALRAGQSDSPSPSTTAPPFDLPRLGDYQLLNELSRGGMGVVYRARQLSLNRIVAIKMILLGQFADDSSIRRFQAEAAAAAKLHHPNIVSIHEIGSHNGQRFFSMEYVEGDNLADFIRTHALSPRDAAQLLKTIAEAIHYAHQQGIVHRDLKPSNILIDCFLAPHITDFGLARDLQSDSDLTITGQVLGSPNYISPEQATGQPADLRSDIYSLGAILYQLLAARPPFAAETLTATLHQVAAADPVSPRLLNPNIPRDLETICLKCLEKNPSGRYASAKALADELGRFVNNEPIQARPVSPPARAWKWCRRRPVVAALAAAFALSLLLGFTGVFWQWQRAERNLYFSTMRRVQNEIAKDNVGHASELLEKYVPKWWQRDLRGWEWYYAWQQCQSDELFSLNPNRWGVYSIAMSKDGSLLASGGQGLITLWNLTERKKLKEIEFGRTVYSLTLSKDDDQLFLGTTDGNVLAWDLATYQTKAILTNLSSVRSLALSPGGDLLATYTHKGLKLWKLGSHEPLARFPKTAGTDNLPAGLAFSPDSRLLAYALEGGEIVLWDISEASEVARLVGHQQNVTALAFSNNGANLISASRDRSVRVWDVKSATLAKTLVGFPAFLNGLALSPDGGTLAVVGAGNSIRLFETGSWRAVRTLVGHKEGSRSVIFSPEGRMIITASKDGSIKFWPASHDGNSESQRLPPQVARVQLLQGGTGLYLECKYRQYAFCDAASISTVTPRQFPSTSTGSVRSTISPDGKVLALATANQVQLFSHPDHVLLGQCDLPNATGRALRFSIDGRRLAIYGDDNVCRVWELQPSRAQGERLTGSLVGDFKLKSNDLRNVKFSSDGHYLGVAYYTPEIAEVWNLRNGKRTELKIKGGISTDIAILRGGSLAVTSAGGGGLAVWDIPKAKRIAALWGQLGTFWSVEFSPDETRIAACGGDGTLRIWDRRTLEEVAAFEIHDERLWRLAFSADGQTLYVQGEDSFGAGGRRLFTLRAPRNLGF